uniref:Uncharacterized protein n=1 Tax=Panagrolaimus davidi TaxID=227884 RepID=A0A914Q0R4_9BILA
MHLTNVQNPTVHETVASTANYISEPQHSFANFLQSQYYSPQMEAQPASDYNNQQTPIFPNYELKNTNYADYNLPPNQYQQNYYPSLDDVDIPFFSCYSNPSNIFHAQSNQFSSPSFTELLPQKQSHENELNNTLNVTPENLQFPNTNNDMIVDEENEKQFWEMMSLE